MPRLLLGFANGTQQWCPANYDLLLPPDVDFLSWEGGSGVFSRPCSHSARGRRPFGDRHTPSSGLMGQCDAGRTHHPLFHARVPRLDPQRSSDCSGAWGVCVRGAFRRRKRRRRLHRLSPGNRSGGGYNGAPRQYAELRPTAAALCGHLAGLSKAAPRAGALVSPCPRPR